MTYEETKILNKIQIKLPNYDIEIIVKALELYLLNIKHCYHNDFMDNERYDKFYFTTWCLYQIFMNSMNYKELQKEDEITHKRFAEIPIYKRISKEIMQENFKKYEELYKKKYKVS